MLISFSQEETPDIVKNNILPLLKNFNIFTFTGPLGAGKSTIIREVLSQMRIRSAIPSPTFSYVNTYTTQNGLICYHFDLYRLKNYQEFIDAGFDEYLAQKNALLFIEWPEIISSLLENKNIKKNICHLELSYKQNDLAQRVLRIKTS